MRDGVDVARGVPAVLSAEEFRRLYPRLRRFAAVVGAVEADPDDLVQEALTRTLESGAGQPIEYLEAYLRRCVVNIESNRRRSNGRRRRREQLVADVELDAVPVYPSDLADLEQLDARDRAILYLREVELCTYGEIAEALAMAEPTVRGRASSARRALRALVTGDKEER
jgi:DNA-directed RNA polymerase specialized sigma24 family protein